MSLYFFILSVISLKEEIISTKLPIFRAFFLAILLESPDMVEKSYVNFFNNFLNYPHNKSCCQKRYNIWHKYNNCLQHFIHNRFIHHFSYIYQISISSLLIMYHQQNFSSVNTFLSISAVSKGMSNSQTTYP